MCAGGACLAVLPPPRPPPRAAPLTGGPHPEASSPHAPSPCTWCAPSRAARRARRAARRGRPCGCAQQRCLQARQGSQQWMLRLAGSVPSARIQGGPLAPLPVNHFPSRHHLKGAAEQTTLAGPSRGHPPAHPPVLKERPQWLPVMCPQRGWLWTGCQAASVCGRAGGRVGAGKSGRTDARSEAGSCQGTRASRQGSKHATVLSTHPATHPQTRPPTSWDRQSVEWNQSAAGLVSKNSVGSRSQAVSGRGGAERGGGRPVGSRCKRCVSGA
mgnify:CR=1 FL=1